MQLNLEWTMCLFRVKTRLYFYLLHLHLCIAVTYQGLKIDKCGPNQDSPAENMQDQEALNKELGSIKKHYTGVQED